MSHQICNYPDLIATKTKNLSLEKQQQVLDFVEFLAYKSTSEPKNVERVPDIHQGEIWMSEDFNKPLDNNFWLGEN